MTWERFKEIVEKPWVIPAACLLLVIVFCTFTTVWTLHHSQTVKVEIVVPGYKQAP